MAVGGPDGSVLQARSRAHLVTLITMSLRGIIAKEPLNVRRRIAANPHISMAVVKVSLKHIKDQTQRA